VNRRRPEQGMLANPILIGALTVLATIVAVTLAYNANNGLPFVPTYSLHVQIADASELTHGAEVHMRGGALVGSVTTLGATRNAAGQPIAVMNLKLQRSIEPLPANSLFTIRLKGAIGLKYLEITPGNSRQTLPNGATVPMSQTAATVDLDQVLSMFDPPTRAGVAAATVGYSSGFAGRGSDLNSAIHAFLPLLTDLEPVARNLSSPRTGLGGFFHGLEAFTGALVPVAQQQADLYANLDTTFTALASVARPFLQDWISQTPPTFQSVITNSPRLQSFLTDTAGLFADLQPGAVTIPKSAPVLADAFAAGTRNLPGTAGLDQRTVSLSRHVASYGENPAVQQGLDRLTLLSSSLHSPLSFLTPVQATCNYVTLFLRNIGSLLSENVDTGTALRFNQVSIAQALGSEGVASSKPYTGPVGNQIGPIHANPYPNTASPGQHPIECAAGNEPYHAGQTIMTNPPGNLGIHTESTSRPK
jgi:phospholipid/cholesterol/gamma-HCH transport system substrate-binding protein